MFGFSYQWVTICSWTFLILICHNLGLSIYSTHISVFIQATGEYPEEEEWWRRDCYKSPDGFLGCKNDDRTNGTMRMDVETCFCQESLCNEKIQDFTTSSTPSTTTPKGNYKIVQRVITPYQWFQDYYYLLYHPVLFLYLNNTIS